MTKKEHIIRYTSDTMPPDDLTDWAKVNALTDDEIEKAIVEDSDAAPILTEDFFRTAKMVCSSSKKRRITIMVDEDVLGFFQRDGKSGYQKRIHDILKAYVRHENPHPA